MSWADRAACKDHPLELFFAKRGDHIHADPYTEARVLCQHCPVRRQCLDETVHLESPGLRHGFRAGMTPTERDTYARSRRRRPRTAA